MQQTWWFQLQTLTQNSLGIQQRYYLFHIPYELCRSAKELDNCTHNDRNKIVLMNSTKTKISLTEHYKIAFRPKLFVKDLKRTSSYNTKYTKKVTQQVNQKLQGINKTHLRSFHDQSVYHVHK